MGVWLELYQIAIRLTLTSPTYSLASFYTFLFLLLFNLQVLQDTMSIVFPYISF